MHYLKRMTKKNGDAGVSPVVGVMLMLVVTIIIAAVVSGFAGSIMTSKEKAPTIAMDIKIQNGGTFANSFFQAKIISVSDPINTTNLKLVTTWGKNGANYVTTVVPGSSVTNWSITRTYVTGAPWGYGPGVSSMNSGVPSNVAQRFGNYTLFGGTIMYALPAGQAGGFVNASSPATDGYGVTTPYQYSSGWVYSAGSMADGMQTVLGNGWEILRTGDTVNVKVIHIPSGAVIFNKNVVVS